MKHVLKNTIILLIILSFAVTAIASCAKKDDNKITDMPEPDLDYTELPYAEKAGTISISGTPISEYTIVIPQDCDLYTKYAAQNLRDYLSANADVNMQIVSDAEEVEEYELLIGKTNRQGSITASSVELDSYEYIIMQDENSVVLYGEGFMVGGAAGDLMHKRAAPAWRGLDVDITNLPTKPVPSTFTFEKANNAILLIGDGMGHNHINMTLRHGLDKFCAADMPSIGEIITQSQSVIDKEAEYTDSAAAATALATGFKTTNLYIGVDPDGNSLVTLRELANSIGAKTAILSTDAITGATPASFLAHYNDRNATEELLRQIKRVKADGGVDYAIGSIGDDLVDRSATVLHSISAKGSQFFSMIEEGYIDKNAHNNDTSGVVHTVKRFDGLIAYCMEFVLFHPDTVVIVTADHETGGITEKPIGDTTKFVFTSPQHTNVNIPIFAIGDGTEIFNDTVKDNTRVPNFIAKIFGDDNFGDPKYN